MEPLEYHSPGYVSYRARVLEDPVAQELELELEHTQHAQCLQDDLESLLDEISILEGQISYLQEDLIECQDQRDCIQAELSKLESHTPDYHTPDYHSLRLFD